MRVVIFFFLLAFGACEMQAQWGVRVGYNFNKTPGWDEFFSSVESRNQSVFESSLSFEVDYWTRLRNHRIEFYPYLSYHQATTTLAVSQNTLGLRQLGAGLKTHIYLLDLMGDCDCPTFSKQGGFFKKGFFLNIDVRGTIGLGLDVGINDLLTITPFVAYNRYFDVSWHELGSSFGQPGRNVSSHINQLQIGVRFGIRSDYEKPRF